MSGDKFYVVQEGPCPECGGRGRLESNAAYVCAGCWGTGIRTRSIDLREAEPWREMERQLKELLEGWTGEL